MSDLKDLTDNQLMHIALSHNIDDIRRDAVIEILLRKERIETRNAELEGEVDEAVGLLNEIHKVCKQGLPPNCEIICSFCDLDDISDKVNAFLAARKTRASKVS